MDQSISWGDGVWQAWHEASTGMFHYFPFQLQYHTKFYKKGSYIQWKYIMYFFLLNDIRVSQVHSHHFPFRLNITWHHSKRLNINFVKFELTAVRNLQKWYSLFSGNITSWRRNPNVGCYFQGAKEEVDVVEDLVWLFGGGWGVQPMGSCLQWGGGEVRL